MVEPQLELQSLGRCILGAFEALSNATWVATEDNGFPSKDRISIEHQRFVLWARGLGLNQVGHASLDYHIRDVPVVKASLADLLAELREHLENLGSIILGNQPAVEQDSDAIHQYQDALGNAASPDDQSSRSSLTSFGSFKEVDFRLASVSKRLDALYELASRIQDPRNRPQRPVEDLYQSVPEGERAAHIESQKKTEILRVSKQHRQEILRGLTPEKLEELKMTKDQFLEKYSSSEHWLIRRTGIANARRKQQFVYWRRNAKLLSRDMTEAGISAQAAPITTQSPASPELGNTESMVPTHSRVSRGIRPIDKDLAWPAAPKELSGNKYFTCPYCRVLCPESYLRPDEWRLHQTHDLQPYHCTYEDCTDPNRIYGSRQDWIDHENQHRRVWHCYIHQEEFETQLEYIQHLNDRKNKHTAEDGLQEIVASVVGSSSKPHRDCPFCPTAFVDVPTMQKHVQGHLERLALDALPDIYEHEEDELASKQASDSHRPSFVLPVASPKQAISHDNTRHGYRDTRPSRRGMENRSFGSRGKFVAIGIDFGTSFSAVSWAFSEEPEKIREISEWPTANYMNPNEVQVPSLYDIDSGKWGYEVTPDMKSIKWLKLLLLNDSDLADEDIDLSKPLKKSREQLAKHPSKISAVEIVGRYLGKLWDHAQTILRSYLDVDGLSLHVAVTVPAIWPHHALKSMRKAADIAGITAKRPMGAPTLEFIHEPEAASLSIMLEHVFLPEIKPGECFVVCDAGGGTVDVISYQVISTQPFRLKECVKGEGGLFGAVQIDEAFEVHLWGRDRLKLNSLSFSEYNTLVVEDWERGVKRTFTNQEQPAQFSLRLPPKVYKFQDRLRNKDQFSLNRSEVHGFFDKSLTGIRALVRRQRKKVEAETGQLPKNILLVGGLGSSLYVYGVLNEVFDETVLRPLNGWSAVARGAVIRLLQDKLSTQQALSEIQKEVLATLPDVTARKSRYSYGICLSFPIDQLHDYDETLDTVTRDPEGDLVAARMVWYLKKGEEVSGKSPLTVPLWKYYKGPIPRKCTSTILYSPDNPPPKRPDSSIEELCTIKYTFDTDFSERKPVGDTDKGYRRCGNLWLKLTFNGEPRWEFRVGSKQTTADARLEYMEKH
ncbi:hypothetical protein BHE90_010742 [Fusarium euwallaceae]|uniref:C2H2-type domain-containing protein n=1 Tax=Fusarium euwallaceae TaxID=1147111 RepID=A0A430LGH7_9HYPO|nr:hypothetical protein BHE90_010742 [Fusarium euwallaceae]